MDHPFRKLSCISFWVTLLGPYPAGSSSLKQSMKYFPDGDRTDARLSTKTGRSSSDRVWNSPESVAVSNFLLSLLSSRAFRTRNCTWSPLVAAFSFAFSIASGEESMPHTSYPSSAKKRACSPVPHPMSRTDPVISPLRTSSTNSFWGRPMSQGGVPRYAELKKSILFGLQRRYPALEFGPVVPDGLFDLFLYCGEERGRHHRLEDSGHVLAVIMFYEREFPCHEFGEPFPGNIARHDGNRLSLLWHWYPFPENPVEVGVFLVQVDIEVETERSGCPGCHDGVAGSIGSVQFLECHVQTAVILHIGLGNQGGNLLDRGEDGLLLPVGMPDQHLVHEPETLDGGGEPLLSPGRFQRCCIDLPQIIPERIVDSPYCIDRFGHDAPLPSRSIKTCGILLLFFRWNGHPRSDGSGHGR